MPPTVVTIDPNTPPGSQSLKQGPARFHEIKNAILQILGFTGVVQEQFGAPFTFSNPATPSDGLLDVVGPPATDLGIATKAYVDARTQFLYLTGAGGTYAANNVSATFAFVPWAIYVLGNSGGTNTGPVTITANAITASLLKANGDPLVAGDFVGSTDYLAIYDAVDNNLHIVDFIGGSVSQVTTLGTAQSTALVTPTTPNIDLLAATKGYADATEGHPALATGSPALPSGATSVETIPLPLWTQTVTTPNDGNNYLVQCSFALWIKGPEVPPGGSIVWGAIWLEANGIPFALGGGLLNDASTTQKNALVNSAGMCPNVFGPNITVTITMKGQASGGGFAIQGTQITPASPAPYLITQLLRTS